jgi:hypothetical protein
LIWLWERRFGTFCFANRDRSAEGNYRSEHDRVELVVERDDLGLIGVFERSGIAVHGLELERASAVTTGTCAHDFLALVDQRGPICLSPDLQGVRVLHRQFVPGLLSRSGRSASAGIARSAGRLGELHYAVVDGGLRDHLHVAVVVLIADPWLVVALFGQHRHHALHVAG